MSEQVYYSLSSSGRITVTEMVTEIGCEGVMASGLQRRKRLLGSFMDKVVGGGTLVIKVQKKEHKFKKAQGELKVHDFNLLKLIWGQCENLLISTDFGQHGAVSTFWRQLWPGHFWALIRVLIWGITVSLSFRNQCPVQSAEHLATLQEQHCPTKQSVAVILNHYTDWLPDYNDDSENSTGVKNSLSFSTKSFKSSLNYPKCQDTSNSPVYCGTSCLFCDVILMVLEIADPYPTSLSS